MDDAWFIRNVADMAWSTVPGGGTWCVFENEGVRSPTLGIGVHVLPPGETPGFYHRENQQEGFLVLAGECIAVVEGEEHRMGPWDYLHCPPGTAHITIGAEGDEPCAILMVGTRSPDERDAVPRRPGRREARRRRRHADRRRARGLRGPAAVRARPRTVPAAAMTDRVAVVDLGSNSFRLVVFTAQDGWWKRTDEIYEPVRIGEGLAATGELGERGMARAQATIEVFAHFAAASGIGPECVFPVATSAIRDATNAPDSSRAPRPRPA